MGGGLPKHCTVLGKDQPMTEIERKIIAIADENIRLLRLIQQLTVELAKIRMLREPRASKR